MRSAAPPALIPGLHRPLDELLDIYVRDGYVYYAALKSDRGPLSPHQEQEEFEQGVAEEVSRTRQD